MEDELLYLTTKELGDKLLQSNDRDEVDQIISIINMNLQKKELIRASALSELQDNIADHISKRVDKNADCFSNKDLLDYFKTVQGILDSQKNAENKPIPTIAIQQNNLTIDGKDELNKDSRDRIADYIRTVLQQKEERQTEIVADSVTEEKEGE